MAGDQLKVLNALDVAKTQWYHFTAIIIAGMGFFTDAYDLFCISLVTKLLGRIYYHVPGSAKPGTLPPNVAAAVNGVAFCGTLAGQLFFGWLGDKLGRKKVYGMTLMVMVLCSVASGLSFGHEPKAVMATLCFFRFWLGFGIGGDYPLSATIMSEYANKKTRGAFVSAVFAMQGFGIMAGGIFAIIISSAFEAKFPAPAYAEDALRSTIPQADLVWRIILMVGAIPAAMTYYSRSKMPETARYTALVAKDAKLAASDMSRVLQVEIEAEQEKVEEISSNKSKAFSLFSKEFMKRHGLHLLGTTSTWFLLDIAFYSQNLFQKDIFSAIGWIPPAQTMNAIQEVFKIARHKDMSSFKIFFFSALLAAVFSASAADFNSDVNVAWGNGRGKILNNGQLLTLTLDKSSGSGFQSKAEYLFGKIDMQIKLVPGNSAGTVTTFYLKSEGSTWDEIDFEFLGNMSGDPYTLHTNVYTQGKGDKEQQFHLWFDPAANFHTYSILWNPQRIIWTVDNTPIREFKNSEPLGVLFPKSKPMRMYASLWNADDWATRGGLVKTDWSKAPFVASYRHIKCDGCVHANGRSSCSSTRPTSNWYTQQMDSTSQARLRWVQKNYMIYNYCTDSKRFPQGIPRECATSA